MQPKAGVKLEFSTANGATVSSVQIVSADGTVMNTIPVTANADGTYSVNVAAVKASGASLPAAKGGSTYTIKIVASDGSVVEIPFTVPQMRFDAKVDTPVFTEASQKSAVLTTMKVPTHGLVLETGSVLAKVSFSTGSTAQGTVKAWVGFVRLSDITITQLGK